jgi:hypothetical protein
MALLKPPAPVIPKIKYYVRIAEPLALTMERYAEFLGATTIDYVISQALQLVFGKDSDFKDWLEQHPQPEARKGTSRRSSAAVAEANSIADLARARGEAGA